MFDDLLVAQEARYAAQPRSAIKITLPDGAVKEGTSWETTPLDIAKDYGFTIKIYPLAKVTLFISILYFGFAFYLAVNQKYKNIKISFVPSQMEEMVMIDFLKRVNFLKNK